MKVFMAFAFVGAACGLYFAAQGAWILATVGMAIVVIALADSVIEGLR